MASGPVKKRVRVVPIQLEGLVEEVEQDRTLHTEKFVGARGKVKWEKVALRLNNLGPRKNWAQWKQVWRDLQGRVRKTNAELLRAYEATGKQEPPPHLSDLEKRVLAIIGLGTTMRAAHVVEEIVFPSIPTFDTFEKIRELIPPTPKSATITPIRPVMEGTNASLMAVADTLSGGLASVAEAIRGLGDLAGALNNLAEAIRKSRLLGRVDYALEDLTRTKSFSKSWMRINRSTLPRKS